MSMKQICLVCFVTCLLALMIMPTVAQHGTTYYVSNAGDDANDGLSPDTAWQTIEHANTVILADNDAILFRRGDVFRGEFRLYKTPVGVTVGAYSAGDDPVLAGSAAIENWTETTHADLPDGVYEADVSAVNLDEGQDIHHLFVDGEIMVIARYPNVALPSEKNWLNVDETAGVDGFRDAALAALNKPDDYWQGATLRIRNYSWTFTTAEITSSIGSTGEIHAERLKNQLPEWGYFIDNKIEELDYEGEWFYDAVAKKVYLYPKGGLDPNAALIEGATFTTGFTASSDENQTIVENITFRHYTGAALHVSLTDGVIVRNCHFEHNTTGVSVWNGANVSIENNTFDHNLNKGVSLNAQTGFDLQAATIEKNQITNTAMYPGYGARYDGVYLGHAISVFGEAYTIRQNFIDTVSHTGIYLKDDGHHVVENNVVQNVLLLLNDGGAISIGSDGNVIRGNFLLNSHGNTDESNGCGSTNSDPCMHHSPYGMGIGADSKFSDNVIVDNVIANNRDMGIRLNAFTSSTVQNNIVYNSDPGIVVQDKKGPSYNNLVENNIVYGLHPDQLGLVLTNDTDHGTFRNNVYGNPYSKITIKRDGVRYSLAHFRDEFPSMEQGSMAVHVAFPEYTVISPGTNVIPTRTNMIENSFFETDVSGWKPASHVFHDTTQAAMDGGSMRAEYLDSTNDMNAIPNTLAIEAGQWYQLRFSVMANGFGQFRLRGNRTAPSYRILEERFFALDTTRNDYSLLFEGQETTDSFKWLFATDQDDADTYWLDNVTFEPVTALPNDAQFYSKLFMNPTGVTDTIDLQSIRYQDLSGNVVAGSIELGPYSAEILLFVEYDFGWSIYLPLLLKS